MVTVKRINVVVNRGRTQGVNYTLDCPYCNANLTEYNQRMLHTSLNIHNVKQGYWLLCEHCGKTMYVNKNTFFTASTYESTNRTSSSSS